MARVVKSAVRVSKVIELFDHLQREATVSEVVAALTDGDAVTGERAQDGPSCFYPALMGLTPHGADITDVQPGPDLGTLSCALHITTRGGTTVQGDLRDGGRELAIDWTTIGDWASDLWRQAGRRNGSNLSFDLIGSILNSAPQPTPLPLAAAPPRPRKPAVRATGHRSATAQRSVRGRRRRRVCRRSPGQPST